MLAQCLGRHVFVHVVDHPLAAGLEQQADGNQLGIVKMIDVGILGQCRREDPTAT